MLDLPLMPEEKMLPKRRITMTDEARQFMDGADTRLRAKGIEPGDRLSFRDLDEAPYLRPGEEGIRALITSEGSGEQA